MEQNFEESSRWHIDSHWEWPSGMELHTGFNYVSEGLYQPFEIPGHGRRRARRALWRLGVGGRSSSRISRGSFR